MRRAIWNPLALVLFLVLGACGDILGNVPVLETPRERLAALEIAYQGANLSIQDLVVAGTLHGEAAEQVADLLAGAHVAIEAVRAGIDGPGGVALLEAANLALVALTARLKAEEGS